MTEADDGADVRAVLARLGVPAGLAARLKRLENGIVLCGRRVTVRERVRAGDVLELAVEDSAPTEGVAPADLAVEIVLQTTDLLVANKPPFMPTHPSHGHREDTLANALVGRLSTPETPFCPRFVNRLDRNTSGAVLVACHALAAAKLSRAMAAGEIKKTYLALAVGEIAAPLTVKTDIRRVAGDFMRREVCAAGEGRVAITQIEPLAADGEITLLRLTPHTGRTHQLRVHLAYIGHPLVGDELYGTPSSRIARHALHAASLSFPDPATGARRTVTVPPPPDFLAVAETFSKEVAYANEAPAP